MTKTIEKECIEYLKKNDKLKIIAIPTMRDFLEKQFGIFTKKTIKKADISALVYSKLNCRTLKLYAENLKGFAFTSREIVDIFDCSQYLIKKLTDSNKINVIGEYTLPTNKNIKYNLYNIIDCINAYKKGDLKVKEQKKIEKLEATDDNIAKSLYIINKSAKVSRDTKNKCYENRDYKTCGASKTRMLKLYNLKDAVIKKLKAEKRVEYIGIHKQIINNDITYLDLYRLSNYTFHIPHRGYINESEILDGVILDEISADKQNIDITHQQARELLERYINANTIE